MVEIKSSDELGKRCYFNIKISDDCPDCGEEATIDLSQFPLQYPVVGRDVGVFFTCEKHDQHTTWTKDMVLRASLDVGDEKKEISRY